MNLLSFLPAQYKPMADLIIGQIPFLKCVLEGHNPLPLVAGKRTIRNDEGVKQLRLCQHCHLAYWEEPS